MGKTLNPPGSKVPEGTGAVLIGVITETSKDIGVEIGLFSLGCQRELQKTILATPSFLHPTPLPIPFLS